MKQLSGMDNLFLAMDEGHQHLHVAGLGIYDPSTAPGGKVRFKSILNFFVSRLQASKVFRRRLVCVPQDLDRPYWVEDGEIDVEYHVRHIALPHPGDWRQLMIQIARLHSRALDMTKPLWEAYIIEGLDNIPGLPPGSFAVYTKFHHAAVDGEAGAVIIRALHALSPDEGLEEVADTSVKIADRDPSVMELYARAIGSRSRQAVDASRLLLTLGSRLAMFGKDLIATGRAAEIGMELLAKVSDGKPEAGKGGKDTPGRKPHTRFDRPVSAHRVVDAVGIPLADCKTIRQHVPDVTINDIFMATCGGALRAYLDDKGELPKKTLNAMMPMTTRGEVKDADAGNQIGMTTMPLRTDIAEPIERLLAVRRGSGKSKALSAALGKDLPAKLIQVLPAMASKLLIKQGIVALSNVTVSNVRGPDVPLYMAGARLMLYLPISIAFDNLGLNITGFSYHGTLWVCFVSCRKMMPDPGVFADCLKSSFQELLQGAMASGKGKSAAPAKTAKPRAKTARLRARAATPTPAKRMPRTRRKPTKPAGKSGTKASRIATK